MHSLAFWLFALTLSLVGGTSAFLLATVGSSQPDRALVRVGVVAGLACAATLMWRP